MRTTESKELQEALQAPFHPQEIEWRVQESGRKQTGELWCKMIPYLTARAIHDRLDDVMGPENWRVEYTMQGDGPNAGILCHLSLRIGGEWVSKSDGCGYLHSKDEARDEKGGGLSANDAVKGSLSGAIKRAAVVWGVGRMLYKIEAGFGEIVKDRTAGSMRVSLKAKDANGKITREWCSVMPPRLAPEFLPPQPDRQPQPLRAEIPARQPQQLPPRRPANLPKANLQQPGANILPKIRGFEDAEGYRLDALDDDTLGKLLEVFKRNELVDWAGAVADLLSHAGAPSGADQESLPF